MEFDIWVPENSTVEETIRLIREEFGIKSEIKVIFDKAQVSNEDSVSDWLARTGNAWDFEPAND
jgi:hypothetical protein